MLGGTGATLPPETLSKYAGTYEFAPGREARITVEGGLLFIQEGANPLKKPLAPDSETVFVSRTEGDLIEFSRNAQGEITGFMRHSGNVDQKAVRK